MTEETIFAVALEKADPAERAAFLDAACGGDAALRRRVEALLGSHADPSFLGTPAVHRSLPPGDETRAHLGDNANTSVWVGPAAEAGTVLAGRYKLLEPIGEGGMGAVWMAEQTEPVRRRVAVKVIKPGMDSRQVLARFEAERQALALMDHPNIAKVLDGGAAADGRPFFVMELVKGVPLTAYCDEKKLGVRERLALFADVCRAVQHAHQKGVIHRDIKPSNVLVAPYDGRPVVKVIDFGIAKAAGPQLTEKTLFTGFGAVVGTPEYMSPEQADVNNQDIDTRSDVYSLGVLLYELLTGTTPLTRQRVKEAALLEVLRLIREEEPPRPSTRLSTANGLASVAAVRGEDPARLTRLVRGELDWIVMKALEKDRNCRYETANGLAAEIDRYLSGEPVQAVPPSAGYRLRKFARRNKGALAGAGLVIGFLVLLSSGVGWVVRDRMSRQAKVAGQVELIVGEVEQLEREQKWPDALAAAKRADAAVASGGADDATLQRVRDLLKELAFIDRLDHIRMARMTIVEGKFNEAAAVRDYGQAFRDHGVDVEVWPAETAIEHLRTRPALAIPLAAALDDWAAARRAVSEQDMAGWKRLVDVARGIDPEPVRDRLRAAWGRQITPELQADLRRLAESCDVRSQHVATLHRLTITLIDARLRDVSVRILRGAQQAHPGDFWLNFELGHACNRHEDYEGAVRFWTASVSIRPLSIFAHNNLGTALAKQGKRDEAIACFRTAIELDPKFAPTHNNLGILFEEQGKWDEAITCFRKVIELNPKDPPSYTSLLRVLSKARRYAELTEACRDGMHAIPDFAQFYVWYVALLERHADPKAREPAEELQFALKAVQLVPADAEAWQVLGWAQYRAGNWAECIKALDKSIDLQKDGGDAAQWYFLALAHYQLGQKDDARRWYDKAVAWKPRNADAAELLARFRAEAGALLGVPSAPRPELAPPPRPVSANPKK